MNARDVYARTAPSSGASTQKKTEPRGCGSRKLSSQCHISSACVHAANAPLERAIARATMTHEWELSLCINAALGGAGKGCCYASFKFAALCVCDCYLRVHLDHHRVVAQRVADRQNLGNLRVQLRLEAHLEVLFVVLQTAEAGGEAGDGVWVPAVGLLSAQDEQPAMGVKCALDLGPAVRTATRRRVLAVSPSAAAAGWRCVSDCTCAVPVAIHATAQAEVQVHALIGREVIDVHLGDDCPKRRRQRLDQHASV